MSLLPQRIIPQTIPFGTVNEDGTVTIEQNWWLFLYALAEQILGPGSTATQAEILANIDADVDSTLPQPQTIYQKAFGSGWIQYGGPNNSFAGNVGFQFGTNLPNPTGIPGPCLFLGSGGGNGTPVTFGIIMAQAFDDLTPGNNLVVSAGQTQPAGTQNGGNYTDYGGASNGGTGGTRTIQGGTSLNGPAGNAVTAGGNSTNGPAGNAILIGGQTGTAGGNADLCMTKVNAISGFIRHRMASTVSAQDQTFIDEYDDGSWYIYLGGGFGTAGQVLTSGGIGEPIKWAALPATVGYSGTITTAKLTIAGTEGSMTFANGLLTAQTAAT